ncbi:MAG: 5'/3'-nucleotidase SurE [Desulforhopalus sp.]|nr:5'/3'-nucleotidase SurE [Desulforhopalus sp.]
MTTILITNDDGIHSPGLAALEAAMATLGNTVIVAPDRDNSAVSHSLTINRPLKLTRHGVARYDVNGTPADCVVLGLSKVLREPPALVVSGFNLGPNLGDDIAYSGTVSAAVEGTMKGCPSIAFSTEYSTDGWDFDFSMETARRVAARVLERGLPGNTLLNVNIPKGHVNRETRITCQGRRQWEGDILEVSDPRGRIHYWIGGGSPISDRTSGSDVSALEEGFVSITPIHLDHTNHEFLRSFREQWGL